jgi:hypothetical protein
MINHVEEGLGGRRRVRIDRRKNTENKAQQDEHEHAEMVDEAAPSGRSLKKVVNLALHGRLVRLAVARVTKVRFEHLKDRMTRGEGVQKLPRSAWVKTDKQ